MNIVPEFNFHLFLFLSRTLTHICHSNHCQHQQYLSQKVTTAKQMQKTGNDDDEEDANTTDEPTNDEN